MRRLLLAAALVLGACGAPDHQNPYDPATPEAQQARAALTGSITLETVNGAAPLPSGVLVSVTGPRATRTAVTDAQGVWTASDLPAGTYRVSASRSGYRDAWIAAVTVTLDDGGTTLTVPPMLLSLGRGVVSGRVKLLLPDLTEELAGGASVGVHGLAGTVSTAKDGTFLLSDVPAGSYVIDASKYGFLAGSTSGITVSDLGDASVGTLSLDTDPGWFVGTTTRADGGDVRLALVRARGYTLGGTPWESSAHPAADGSILISNLPAGTYEVTYELTDHATPSAAALAAPGRGTELAPTVLVRDTGSIVGVARLEGAGDHSGIQVSLTPPPTGANPSPLPLVSTLTDASGGWRADLLPVGTYRVDYARAPGYVASHADVTIVKGTVTTGPVTLAALPATVRGRCLLEGAAPGASGGTTVRVEGTTLQTGTLGDGSWSIAGLAAGAWNVVYERTGFDGQRAPVTVAPGGDLTLADVTLAISRGAVGGTVELAGMASSGGVVVTASGAAGSASTVSDQGGAFTISGLPVGSYSVTARKDPDWVAAGPVAVTVSGHATAPAGTLSLSPAAASYVAGTVRLEGGSDFSNVQVTLSGADFRGVAVGPLTTRTTIPGAWSFGPLAAGSYQVTYAITGWDAPAAAGVSLATGQSADVGTVTLAASRGAVTGSVTAAGAGDPSGTLVTATGPEVATAVTDATGAFRIAGLRVGTYQVTVKRDGYAVPTTPVTVVVPAGGEVAAGNIALSLDYDAFVSGVASVARPAGASGAIAVVLTGTDLNGAAVTRSTATSGAGAYTLTSVPQGTYTLTFAKSPYVTQTVSGVFVAAGRAVAAPGVTLPVATGGLSGAVALDVSTVPGFPAIGDRSGTVVVLLDGASTVDATVTDAAGGYRFAAVPALPASGPSYTISARRPSFSTPSLAATPQPDVILPGNDLVAVLQAGTLGGTVVLFDNVGGLGANPSAEGAQVTISGTAFNGVAWTPPTQLTPASGAWTFSALPPGTYDVTVTSSGRSCEPGGSAAVEPGTTASAGPRTCADVVAPGPVGLGQPVATGGISGYVSGTTVTIPILQQATDGTLPVSNLYAYEWAIGAAPTFESPTVVLASPPPATLDVSGLPTATTSTIWVRARDWMGNVGPSSSVAVVQDFADPVAPTLTAPAVVSDASATVTLSGSDTDPSFLRYELSTSVVLATATCPPGAPGGWIAVPQSYPLGLVTNRRTCVWARAVARSGRLSAVTPTSIVNDSALPSAPVFRPSYDPSALTIRAAAVDFFLAAPATDGAWGPSWKGIGRIEVDTGAGFDPICPASACHPGESYNPCAAGCGCTDVRVRCDGTTFVGLHVTLANESLNPFAVRAVNLAGTPGPGVSQDVAVETSAGVVSATAATEYLPNVFGDLVTYARMGGGTTSQEIVVLGRNRRVDATDTTCSIAGGWKGVFGSPSLLVYVASNDVVLRRAAAGQTFCGADTTTPLNLGANAAFVTASGERIAWAEGNSPYTLKVREPGANGLVGDPDDVTTALTFAGTNNYVYSMQLAGNHLLVYTNTPGGIFQRVFSAPGGFRSGVSAWDLPNTEAVALSPDGAMLAFVSGSTVRIYYPTAGRYGAGSPYVQRTLPAGFYSPNSVAIDGTHLVVADQGGGAFVHWDAGPDGRFDAAGDDTFGIVKPSKAKRDDLSLSGGLLVYTENADIYALDLTSFRWEDVPASFQHAGAGAANANNTVLFGGYNGFYSSQMNLTARCPAGIDRSLSYAPYAFAADGDYVVANMWHTGVYLHTRDTAGATPSGCFFTGTATSRLVLGSAEAGPAYYYPFDVAVQGETLLVANQYQSASVTTNVWAIEPTVAGSTLAASGTTPFLLASGISSSSNSVGLTTTQAIYWCGRGAGSQLCARTKNPVTGLFRDATTPEVVLVHPPNSTKKNQGINGEDLKVSGTRMVVNSYDSGAGLYLIDAGLDGDFTTTTDNREAVLVDHRLMVGNFAIGGDWVAYVDAGPPGGDQIFLYNVLDRSVRQLTFHSSGKTNVTVDPRGRVWWEDSVFPTSWSLWVRTP